LNATLIAWGPGDGPGEQVNASRDVLYVVVAGSAMFEIDASSHALRAPAAVLVAKGKRRKITAGDEGVRYVTAHLRRGGLEISRSGAAER
jgi:mannose-6-phosphate isomerase-like protein (cupin superfamily)